MTESPSFYKGTIQCKLKGKVVQFISSSSSCSQARNLLSFSQSCEPLFPYFLADSVCFHQAHSRLLSAVTALQDTAIAASWVTAV